MIHGKQKYLIVLAGPTAVGKTDLAIELALQYETAIISADSRQIYRELNIGTAKPTLQQLQAAPHYMVGTKSVDELYGAGHFASEAAVLLDQLFETRQVVILTGGSGLYINALLEGMDEFEEVPISIRETLNAEFAEKGINWLKEELMKVDPIYAEQADLNNPQRLIRALEVYRHTGQAYSSFRSGKNKEKNYKAINLLINRDRSELYQRINERVDHMMALGLLEEVKSLFEKKQFNALKTVGYSELYQYLENKCSLEYAIDKIKQHTRNYAKRQLTWFRNKGQFKEFNAGDLQAIESYISQEML